MVITLLAIFAMGLSVGAFIALYGAAAMLGRHTRGGKGE